MSGSKFGAGNTKNKRIMVTDKFNYHESLVKVLMVLEHCFLIYPIMKLLTWFKNLLLILKVHSELVLLIIF